MPFRTLEYVVMIYKKQMRDWLKKHGSLDKLNLQPVLPIDCLSTPARAPGTSSATSGNS